MVLEFASDEGMCVTRGLRVPVEIEAGQFDAGDMLRIDVVVGDRDPVPSLLCFDGGDVEGVAGTDAFVCFKEYEIGAFAIRHWGIEMDDKTSPLGSAFGSLGRPGVGHAGCEQASEHFGAVDVGDRCLLAHGQGDAASSLVMDDLAFDQLDAVEDLRLVAVIDRDAAYCEVGVGGEVLEAGCRDWVYEEADSSAR